MISAIGINGSNSRITIAMTENTRNGAPKTIPSTIARITIGSICNINNIYVIGFIEFIFFPIVKITSKTSPSLQTV